jgi:hypothetical protein
MTNHILGLNKQPHSEHGPRVNELDTSTIAGVVIGILSALLVLVILVSSHSSLKCFITSSSNY